MYKYHFALLILASLFSSSVFAVGYNFAGYVSISGSTLSGTYSARWDSSSRSFIKVEKKSGNNSSNRPIPSTITISARNSAGSNFSCRLKYDPNKLSVWEVYESLAMTGERGTFLSVRKDAAGNCYNLNISRSSYYYR